MSAFSVDPFCSTASQRPRRPAVDRACYRAAIVAAWAVFRPHISLSFFGAPYYRRFAQNRQVRAFIKGVTVAAVGAIAGAAYILARRSLIDVPTILIGIIPLFVLMTI